jgi:hypothetical protein
MQSGLMHTNISLPQFLQLYKQGIKNDYRPQKVSLKTNRYAWRHFVNHESVCCCLAEFMSATNVCGAINFIRGK